MRYYDRQGNPITLDQWANGALANSVAKTDVGVSGTTVHVSTVWLGLDHSFGDGPLLIFETMVFGGNLDLEMDRYTTEAEALAGHAAMCERVQAS